MSLKRLYGQLTKFEEQADGTLIAEGICSSEAVDSQGEVVKASAMAAALPDYMKFANVREMHQAIAAGKALACSVDDAGMTHITAHVVDANSILKVKTKVLQGFSIGGTVPSGGRNKDNPKIIEAIRLSEISLVDRPANPDSVINFFKTDVPAEEPPPEEKKVEPPPEVKKGMYTVAWAAELCQSLSNLAADTQWEADFEGDDSAIPGRVKALLVEFAAILRDLVAEETAELVGEGTAEADAVAMVNKPGALKKSERVAALVRAVVGKKGSKFSKATQAALAAVHKCIKDADAGMSDVGYAKDDDSDDMAAAEKTGDLQKTAADATAKLAEAAAKLVELEKRAADAETATKAAGEALRKVMAERDELKVKLETKGALKVVPIAKVDDVTEKKKAEDFEKLDPLEQVKVIQASGGRRIA